MFTKFRIVAIAAAMAIVPTVGSQGVGTITSDYAHVDAALFVSAGDARRLDRDALLRRADATARRLAAAGAVSPSA